MIYDRFWSGKKYLYWLFCVSIFTACFAGLFAFFEKGDDWIWWIPLACFPVIFMLTHIILMLAGVVIVEDDKEQEQRSKS